MNKPIHPLSSEIIDIFMDYDWPGNIRELKNIVERLVVMSKSCEITASNIPEELRKHKSQTNLSESNLPLQEAKAIFEKNYVANVLLKNRGNVALSSKELEIAPKNLYKKIKAYKIQCKSR